LSFLGVGYGGGVDEEREQAFAVVADGFAEEGVRTLGGDDGAGEDVVGEAGH
jgi:hypothetical protein